MVTPTPAADDGEASVRKERCDTRYRRSLDGQPLLPAEAQTISFAGLKPQG
jgi:hypothetical protein